MIANAAPGQNSLWGKNLDVLPFWLYDLSIHTSMSVFELWNGKGLPSVQHHRVVFLSKLTPTRFPPYYHTTERQNKSYDGLFVNKLLSWHDVYVTWTQKRTNDYFTWICTKGTQMHQENPNESIMYYYHFILLFCTEKKQEKKVAELIKT